MMCSKKIVVVQARMGASRLPGKILLPLGEHPVLWHVIERCRRATAVDEVWVATTTNPLDDVLEVWCKQYKCLLYRGDEDDVLRRFADLTRRTGAEIVVRVTADCPLIDPPTIDRVIHALQTSGCDYAHVKAEPKYPDALPRGLNVEALWAKTLWRIEENAYLPRHREHVTLLVEEDSSFRLVRLAAPEGLARPHYRLTLDTPADFVMLYHLFSEGAIKPITPLEEVIAFLDHHPEIMSINASVRQKEV